MQPSHIFYQLHVIPSSQRLGGDKDFHNKFDALSNPMTTGQKEQQRPGLWASLLSHRCFRLSLCETSMPSCAVTGAGYLSLNGKPLPAIPTKLLGRIELKLTNSFVWSGDMLEAQLDFFFFPLSSTGSRFIGILQAALSFLCSLQLKMKAEQ